MKILTKKLIFKNVVDDNQQIEVVIAKIGGMGDGIGEYEGKPVFVPLTCAGDEVLVAVESVSKDKIQATLIEIKTASSNRQKPACQHFSKCGGCKLQHLNKQYYNEFKQDMLTRIIASLEIDESVIAPMIEVGERSRRRAEFKVTVNKGEVSIGFFEAKSHKVVALTECLVSEDRLIAILPDLKNCLQSLKKPGLIKSVGLTTVEAGLDMVVSTQSAIGNSDSDKFIEFAKENNIVRLSDGEEILYDSGDAKVVFGDVEVDLPVAAFLQATKSGEIAITEFVTKHLSDCERAADLYAGCGTYSFPLAKQAQRVSAYEGSEDMVLAMHNAIIRNKLDGKVSANIRDLYSNPLEEEELNNFDGVVINPPRNGALPQVKNIAKSNIGKVVMVSCNPVTFKRDTKVLIDSGYKMTSAVPIDQFLWSRHLEIVAMFVR